MFRNKPTVGSIQEGIYCSFPLHNITRSIIPCSATMRRAPCDSVIDLIMQIQEEHGMPSIKHYEIPFERGYVVLFPSSYSVNNRHKAE